MVSSLGDSRGAASAAAAAAAAANSKRDSASEAQNVAGQVLELDLYDHDEGVFDADDFLGRVLLPLERVPTASEGGDKHTLWMTCLLYTSPSPRDVEESRMPSSA